MSVAKDHRDPLERLIDLITLLLNSRRPLEREEIFNSLPDEYSGNQAAAERKFERDKQELLKLGIPLRYSDDDLEEPGYLIDREQYTMPKLELAPDELAMLYLTGTAALETGTFPFARDLVMALNKIGLASGAAQTSAAALRRKEPLLSSALAGQRLSEHLQLLREAVAARKKVLMVYQSFWKGEQSKRWVDPYGICFVRGVWYLVGHCHLRRAIRVFHLERITALEKNKLMPARPDFEVPAGFQVRDHVAAEPWLIKIHEPRKVVLRFWPPVVDTAANELGPLADKCTREEDTLVVELQATYLDGLLPKVLWYRHRVQVLQPRQLANKVTASWSRLAGDEAEGA